MTMTENPIASIPLRIPLPMSKTFPVAMALFFGYLITVVLAFVFQNAIQAVTGVNPAHMSIVVLMLLLVIPWALCGWWLFKKYSKVGKLHLFESSLTITGENDELIKSYPAIAVDFIKIQNAAFHITFKDGYRFNALNIGMPDNFGQQLMGFQPKLLEFVSRNNLTIKKGNIV